MLMLGFLLIYGGIAVWFYQIYHWVAGSGWQSITFNSYFKSTRDAASGSTDIAQSVFLTPLDWSIGMNLVIFGCFLLFLALSSKGILARWRARRQAKSIAWHKQQQLKSMHG